jgi:hypothetical protein
MNRDFIAPQLMSATVCRAYATAAGIAARTERNNRRRDILYSITRAWESLAKQTQDLEELNLQEGAERGRRSEG